MEETFISHPVYYLIFSCCRYLLTNLSRYIYWIGSSFCLRLHNPRDLQTRPIYQIIPVDLAIPYPLHIDNNQQHRIFLYMS